MNGNDSLLSQVRGFIDENPDMSKEQMYKYLIESNVEMNPRYVKNTANSYWHKLKKVKA